MKRDLRPVMNILAGGAAAALACLALAGNDNEPFAEEVKEIGETYSGNPGGRIVFYGASNFRLWPEMDKDLVPYPVENHGFGGSTDKLLVRYAERLLYPYRPKLVFFQTGSNDYVAETGSDEEKVRKCMAYKEEMFRLFHEKLPDATFVVMSGLLLPGRSEYLSLTKEVNRRLKALCSGRDYMVFCDSEAMTYEGGSFRTELFREDGIHLNREGQLLWAKEYILPALRTLWRAE